MLSPGVGVVSGVIILASAIASCTRDAHTILYDTTSPDGRLELRVRGNIGTPSSLLTRYVVTASVRRQNNDREATKLCTGTILKHSDPLDKGFGEMFGSPTWLADGVVRFQAHADLQGNPQRVRIENHMSSPANCLVVNASDLFLVPEVQAASTVEWEASPLPKRGVPVCGATMFSRNGDVLSGDIADRVVRGTDVSLPITCKVTVREGGVETSFSLEAER